MFTTPVVAKAPAWSDPRLLREKCQLTDEYSHGTPVI
jgi:hypothetical protein